MTIGPINTDHIGAVAELLKAHIRGGGHTSSANLAQATSNPHWIGLQCTQGAAVIGAITGQCVSDQAEIHEIAVLPEERRKGIASALVDAFSAEAHARGAQTCFLEVRQQNAGAVTMYRRNGFAQCGTRKAYYADGENAIVMSRGLEPKS